jgi:hypothetical protein
MEPNIYHKLEALSLPHPRVYQLEELIKEDSTEKLYYLRRHPQVDLPSFVTSAYLSQKANDFRKLLADGKIVQIEEFMMSILGGCVVTEGSYRYVELLAGHLSGLLLHGWCQVRAYVDQKMECTRFLEQNLMVEQTIQGYRTTRAVPIRRELVAHLVISVDSLSGHIKSPFLFEFMVDASNQIYFVDMKDYPWELDFYSLVLSHDEQDFIYKQRPLNNSYEQIYEDSFDLRNLCRVNSNSVIRLGNQGGLSHFVTYSLKKGILGIMK